MKAENMNNIKMKKWDQEKTNEKMIDLSLLSIIIININGLNNTIKCQRLSTNSMLPIRNIH